ncbi:hypothetical protein [Stenotrophomonas humi]|uniref:hypothetical protein n=1 Tax=Stenotrophomonas humi TaxID=405444 RepID=UPI00070F30CB|nr:hypothetical protein [Stenotrophomonas humi]
MDTGTNPTELGGWIAAIVTGALGWFSGKAGRKRDNEAITAESRLYETIRLELDRLTEQVRALERRSGRMLNHIYRLEGLMRASGLTPPPFDPDAENIGAGGTD